LLFQEYDDDEDDARGSFLLRLSEKASQLSSSSSFPFNVREKLSPAPLGEKGEGKVPREDFTSKWAKNIPRQICFNIQYSKTHQRIHFILLNVYYLTRELLDSNGS